MLRLLNIILVLVWMAASSSERVTDSPILSDFLKIKQSYVAWPANTPLSLKCKADGATPLKIRWFKDGRLIKQSANIFQDQKWNLKFRKPQLTDNGVYTCVISNNFGVTKHNYSLRILQRVQSPPVLVPGYPKPVTARVGDNVELECLEQPNGQVSDYRWLRTDSLVRNDLATAYKRSNVDMISPQKYKSFELDNEKKKLHGVKLALEHVTEEDTGYYTCFLSNNNGFTNGTAFLNVTPIAPTDPPEFLLPKHQRKHFIMSVENEDVSFSCSVRGGAPLKYRWFYNGRLLNSDEKHQISESELKVRHVHRTDKGVYTCKIRNDYGQVKHNFKLKVLAQEPMFPIHPVLLAGYPKDKTAMVGDSASLYCAEISDTLVDYRWLKWNSSVKSITKADLLDATMLTILHPKDYEQPALNKRGVFLKLKNLTKADEGLYTCLVSSHMGYAYRSAYLNLQYPVEKLYETENPLESLREETTPTLDTTVSPGPAVTTRRCLDTWQDLGDDTSFEGSEHRTKCETTGACATMTVRNRMRMFCDELDLCTKYNITSGECGEITSEQFICCCYGEMCNQPSVTFYQETEKAKKSESSSKPHLKSLVFFVAVVLIISVMLALLGYRIRQRKAALNESIVHKTRPSSRKMTKHIVMETRWLKEEDV